MNFSMKTDKGIVRAENQDNCYVSVFNDNSCFAVVCDGMGGPNSGDVASEIAVKSVSEYFSSRWSESFELSEIEKILVDAVKYANTEVYNKSKESARYEGMGTTLVAAVCLQNDIVFANVGDSRAYMADDNLQQVTKDHSLLQEMLDKGQITRKEAENFPYKNIITRALGIDASVKVDTFIYNNISGKNVLLCSDGLYNFVSQEEIVKTLKDVPFAQTADDLINKANSGGGSDNITAVVIFR